MNSHDWESISEEKNINELLHIKKRHRNYLVQNKAAMGSAFPPHMNLELETIEEEIQLLERKLQNLRRGIVTCTCYISSIAEDLAEEHASNIISSLDRLGMKIINLTPNSQDSLEYDLDKIQQADIFIGIWGIIYGETIDEEENKSISHLEYEYAIQHNIPVFIYFADYEHKFTKFLLIKSSHQITNLENLQAEIQSSNYPHKFFDNVDILCGHINSDIRNFATSKRQLEAKKSLARSSNNTKSRSNQNQPLPPLYIPPYILTNKFVGRASELKQIQQWYQSNSPLMVIEAFGGQGKSALAWEWLHNVRPSEPKPAGIIWWSFYGEEATIPNFVRQAYAYVSQQAPSAENLENINLSMMLEQFIQELNKKHYIIVLDGFERMLAAYWRIERAHLEDIEIPDSLEERECISAFDSNVLRRFANLTKSKVLITTRLYPAALETLEATRAFNLPHHITLQGLTLEDALDFAKTYNLTITDQPVFINFLNQIGFHPLVMSIAFKSIGNYRKAPRNFDTWYQEHQHNTMWEQISGPDQLKAILQEISKNLSVHAQNILQRIALFNEPVDFETLLTLYMPKYTPPQNLPKRIRLYPHPFGTIEEHKLRTKLAQAQSSEEQAWYTQQLEQLEAQLEQQAQELLHNRPQLEQQAQAIEQERKRIKQEHYQVYLNSPEYTKAYNELDRALRELDNQGFLTWNREDNTYDLHPLIRTYAQNSMSPELYQEHSEEILDRVSTIPISEQQVVSLTQLKKSRLSYQWLLLNKQYDEAASIYHTSLGLHLYKHAQWRKVVELLQPLFTQGPSHPPVTKLAQSYITNQYGIALKALGRYEEAVNVLKQDIFLEDGANLWLALTNYADALIDVNQLALAHQVYQLAIPFCDQANLSWVTLHNCELALIQGKLEQVQNLLLELEQSQPPANSQRVWQLRLTKVQVEFAIPNRQDPNQFFNENFIKMSASTYYYNKALYAYQQGQQLDEVQSDLYQAISKAEQAQEPSKHLYSLLAMIHLKQGNQREAIATIEQALKQSKGSRRQYILCLLNASDLYLQLNIKDKAARYAQQGYELAWADGGEFCHSLLLREAEQILVQLGQNLPRLVQKQPVHQLPIEQLTQKYQDYLTKNTPPPPQSEVVFSSIEWIQIGTIATFAIKEQEVLEAMAEKLILLSSEPSPLVYSRMGEEVPAPPTEPLQDEQISLDQLIFTYQQSKLLDKIFIIIYLEGKDQQGQEQFAYVNVRADRLAGIISAYEQQTPLELHNASTLVIHGPGRPDHQQRQKLIRDYLFGEHHVNVRMFPNSVEETTEPPTNNRSFTFNTVNNLDIGCIAIFGLADRLQFEETIHKLISLSYQPRQALFSYIDEDITSLTTMQQTQIVETRHFEQIDWNSQDLALFEKIFIIVYIQGENMSKKQQYAFINIRADRINMLMTNIKQGTHFDIFSISTPVIHGIGRPTASELQKMQEDYLYSHTAINIRIFPENLEHYT